MKDLVLIVRDNRPSISITIKEAKNLIYENLNLRYSIGVDKIKVFFYLEKDNLAPIFELHSIIHCEDCDIRCSLILPQLGEVISYMNEKREEREG